MAVRGPVELLCVQQRRENRVILYSQDIIVLVSANPLRRVLAECMKCNYSKLSISLLVLQIRWSLALHKFYTLG